MSKDRSSNAFVKKRSADYEMPVYEKEIKRRDDIKTKCNACGSITRPHKLIDGVCPICRSYY